MRGNRNLCLTVAMGVLWGTGGVFLHAATFPSFTGDSLYVMTERAPDLDTDGLRRELDAINQVSGRPYRVVLLDSAGDTAFAARDYNENLRAHWQQQAAREGTPFDARKEVIIVLTLEDRRISARAGNLLEADYGLTEDVIETELVQRHFVPAARQTSPEEALVDLVRRTEAWLDPRTAPVPPAPRVDPGSPVAQGLPPNDAPLRPPSSPPHRHSSGKAGFVDGRLPWFVLGIIGCGAIGLLVGRSRRRARLRASVIEPYEQYANKVAALLDRVEQLTRRHQLLPYSDPDYTEPMAGETLARYQAVDARIRGLREDWLGLMDVHEEMKLLVESAPRLSMDQVTQLRGMLEAARRLDQILPLANECEEQIDQLEQAHETMAPVLEQVDGNLAEIRRRLDRVTEAGLSTLPYEGVVQDHQEEQIGLKALRTADPVGVRSRLDTLRERLIELRVWLDDVLTACERARAVTTEADALRTEAESAREQGLKLTEDEGNPDPMLSQVRQEHDAARMALDRGEPDTAAGYLEQAFTWAGRARNAMVKQREARVFCEASIPARKQRALQLADKLEEARIREEELRRLHHPGAWQSTAGNWRQAHTVLGGLDAVLEDAEAAATPDAQRYFRAEDLLVHVEQQQALAAELLDAIGLRLDELNALRDACREERRQVETLGEETETYLSRNATIVSPETGALMGSVRDLHDALNRNLALEPTDWTQVAVQLERLQEGYRSVRTQAEEEARAHADFIQAIDQAAAQARSLGTLLEQHTEDRRRANAAYENAHRELGRIQAERNEEQPDWVGLAARLAGVREGLQRSEQWAHEDINLARQAQAALDRADSKIHQAKSYYRHGVSADVHRAYDLAGRARDQLFNREYERVIEEAAAVEQEVQAAMVLARRRTRDRQREVTRQRLAQVATTLVQVAAVAHSARSGHRNTSRRSHRIVRPPPIGSRPTFPSRSWPRGDTRW